MAQLIRDAAMTIVTQAVVATRRTEIAYAVRMHGSNRRYADDAMPM